MELMHCPSRITEQTKALRPAALNPQQFSEGDARLLTSSKNCKNHPPHHRQPVSNLVGSHVGVIHFFSTDARNSTDNDSADNNNSTDNKNRTGNNNTCSNSSSNNNDSNFLSNDKNCGKYS